MKNNKLIVILLCFLLVLGLTAITMLVNHSKVIQINSSLYNAYIEQDILEVKNTIQEQTSLFYEGKLIGVINDPEKINKMLKEVYEKDYKHRFPNSSLSLGIDIHNQSFYSLQTYEDKDEEILNFIKKNKLFSIEATQVAFSNGSMLYILDENEYKEAKQMFVQNFVGNTSQQMSDETVEYGRTILSHGFVESETFSKGYAPVDMVLQTKEEIVGWFLNGYDESKTTYVVEDGDTVQGAASKNALEVIELMALNHGTLLKENQLLDAGTILDVTGIHSPVNYQVIKEATTKTTLYPESPKYIPDSTLPLGVQKVVQEEKLGYQKDTVKEIYINGVLSDYEIISTEEVSAPQQMIVRRGTQRNSNYVDSGNLHSGNISAGNFRFPTYNPYITCGWGCYYGHQAMDIANLYNRFGEVLASDSGTVITNSFNYVNGYYMVISHGGGFTTYYGHMNQPGFVEVGEQVVRGQVIGQIGQTGVATGPHIHFEIRYNGQKMNPALYLR